MSKSLIELMKPKNFDEFSHIVRKEPQKLEMLFNAELNKLLKNTKNPKALKALQVDIELMRHDTQDPMARCVILMNLISKNAQQTVKETQKVQQILAGEVITPDEEHIVNLPEDF
tara:strand:- start:91594 stop:91938 length:345 start_codon:yes stop_codon:yes gene_type:complete